MIHGCLRAWMLVLVVLAAGCERTNDDLPVYINEIKARPAAAIAPPPELASFPVAAREIGRDPFQRLAN